MLNIQILTDKDDLQHLLGLYRKRATPNSTHGYYTLKNFIRWLELNRNIDHVTVFVLENWRESGFFIILDGYHMFINTLNLNEKELFDALMLWNWNREYKICALPAFLQPIVDKTLRELNMNTRRMVSLKIYQRDVNFNSGKKMSIPDYLVLRPLSTVDASIINDTWYSCQNGSLQFIESLIKYNISFGLYNKEDNEELVAWCTRCQCGFLGTLHVKEPYRAKGLATILIEKFAAKVSEQGEDVRTMISQGNLASQKLFSKLGFKSHTDVVIMYNAPN